MAQPPLKKRTIDNQVTKNFFDFIQDDHYYNDVEFIVGSPDEQMSFNVNKTLFASQSKVFDAMLSERWNSNCKDEPIKITDVTPVAFGYLHRLFYQKLPQLTSAIVIDVWYAANKYLIDVAIEECNEMIANIKEMDDVLTILSSIGKYPPNHSLFDKALSTLIDSVLIQQSIGKFIGDDRFNGLPIFVILNLSRLNLFSSEAKKYETFKNYCMQHTKHAGDAEMKWQRMFRDNFKGQVMWTGISDAYLLSNIANDKLWTAKGILDVITRKQKFGFKFSDVLLSRGEMTALKIGDFVDAKDKDGLFYKAKVESIKESKIRMKFSQPEFDKNFRNFALENNHCIAEYGLVTGRKSMSEMSRPCLKNIKVGDELFVNYGYCKKKGRKEWERWKLTRAVRHKFSGARYFQFEAKDYFIHADSLCEVACLNDKCRYCYFNR